MWSIQKNCFVYIQVVFEKFLNYVVWFNWYFSPSNKQITPMNVVGITDVQQKMFVACFEGCIISMYGSVNVPRSGFNISIMT
jgi:hypothetical protein